MLRMGVAVLLLGVLALGFGWWHRANAMEQVALGNGLAGVDPALAAAAKPVRQIRPTPMETLRRISRSMGFGRASHYGPGLEGNPTASGEAFNPRRLTAAHRTLPLGSRVRVINPTNGRSVVVRINDRGPFVKGRVIDLSTAAARRIGLMKQGVGRVELRLLINESV
ncbi:septal ring lytic transglycosylase RlpA family protein [Stakelama sp. CBK3Z-3]|uniref:Endolytic peptidoglycan transglycosylase RlpA n=2 Tax=Stakelama flava TaxID=2860338 RepID=A0ABS6XLZ2_9SPHN|nr:septal ring lytic transglycosylase RlpA family protein [Stakelama flava]